MAKKKDETSFEEQVKNYASQIKEIVSDVEKIRQTPDVYIGALGNKGFLTMIREILQNALDEILKGVALDKNIKVIFDERTNTVTVEDHGRGIPHGKIAIVFGQTHTSSNYEKQLYVYSAGKNGCGGAVTNMLSHFMTVESFILGKGVHVEFNEGRIWKKGEVSIPEKTSRGRQGTVITFCPNEKYMKVDRFTVTWEDVYSLVSSIIPLGPIGTCCEFLGIGSDGVFHQYNIVNKNGITTHLMNMTQTPFIAPILIQNDNGTMKMEMVFTYDTTLDNGFEYELSFNNTCPTEGGKHLEGALDGIVKFFKEYMNKIYLANVKTKEKLVCSINDVKQGLKLVISTFHLYAMYTGQSKEILSNEDIFPFVSQTVYAGLNQYFQQNNGELQKLCKYFRTIIELRMKQDKDRVKLSNSFKASILSGYPDKFKKPNIKKGFELIIVEGDSAFGSAENSRDNLTQGIFPVRGKLPNAFEKTQKEMFENEEVASIFQIMDGGYGKDFDITKVKVSKVIFMADADPDGKHILTLLLRLFALYARPLVEAGMVYAAIPPLYGIPMGKNDYKYFIDKTDYIKFIQQKFSSQNKLTDIKGKALAPKDIVAILGRTEYYAGILESTAANYAMDPFLLECILINQGASFQTFKKNIQKQYRFMEVTQTKGAYVLDGLAADKKHTVFVDNRLLSQCTLLSKYLRENQNYYALNDQMVSLYGLRLAFSKYEPPSLSRFKGLGEMDQEMLAKSTLRPDGDRFLIRYTFKDIERELREMRAINSSKDVLLKDLIVDKHDVY